VPTSLLWGERDRFVPLALAQAASSRPGWPLHVIDDAGHAAHIEQPDAFTNMLDDVLRTQDA
jgi:2-hydroxymuconate-semialdehyde hydrolase